MFEFNSRKLSNFMGWVPSQEKIDRLTANFGFFEDHNRFNVIYDLSDMHLSYTMQAVFKYILDTVDGGGIAISNNLEIMNMYAPIFGILKPINGIHIIDRDVVQMDIDVMILANEGDFIPTSTKLVISHVSSNLVEFSELNTVFQVHDCDCLRCINCPNLKTIDISDSKINKLTVSNCPIKSVNLNTKFLIITDCSDLLVCNGFADETIIRRCNSLVTIGLETKDGGMNVRSCNSLVLVKGWVQTHYHQIVIEDLELTKKLDVQLTVDLLILNDIQGTIINVSEAKSMRTNGIVSALLEFKKVQTNLSHLKYLEKREQLRRQERLNLTHLNSMQQHQEQEIREQLNLMHLNSMQQHREQLQRREQFKLTQQDLMQQNRRAHH